jgi:hypothetical protein
MLVPVLEGTHKSDQMQCRYGCLIFGLIFYFFAGCLTAIHFCKRPCGPHARVLSGLVVP